MTTAPDSAESRGSRREPTPELEPKLRGHMGVPQLVATALAFNAPLAGFAGFLPVVIGFGNGQGAPLTFSVVGAVFLVFAVGLNAMARRMHTPGAFYVYVTTGLGRPAGLAAAVMALLSYVLLTSASYAYGGILGKGLVEGLLNGPEAPWWVWSLILFAGVSALSVFEIQVSARVLGILLGLELVLVLAWNAAVQAKGGPGPGISGSFTWDAFTSGSLPFAIIFGALCISGFESLQVFRQETKDPARTVTRATYATIAILTFLYVVGSYSWLRAFGVEDAIAAGGTDPTSAFVSSLQSYLSSSIADLVTVLLVTSAIAALLALHNIVARYLFALGEDGVLPRPLGVAHARFGSPFNAAVTTATIVFVTVGVFAALGSDPVVVYARLSALGGLGVVSLMLATALAIFMFFRRDSSASPGILVAVASPLIALAGIGTAWYLAVTHFDAISGASASVARWLLLLGLAFIVVPIVAALVLRSSRPATYARIGKQDL